MVTVRQSRTRRTCLYRWIMLMTPIERLGLHLVPPQSLCDAGVGGLDMVQRGKVEG